MISLLLGCYQVCFEIARNLIIKKDKANTGYRIIYFTSGPECSSFMFLGYLYLQELENSMYLIQKYVQMQVQKIPTNQTAV